MKEINEIIVPKEIEFISEWKEFTYPEGQLILDKTICGCGFTEYCLTNNIPTVLCSPRKTLLDNKKEQHPEGNVYYFKNEYDSENYDKDFEEKEKLNTISLADRQEYLKQLKLNLYNWLNNVQSCPKILVTYDSLHHVLDVLQDSINNFAVVVDEFQSIFLDSAFKATVELDFIDDLKLCQNVLYLSATPMLEKYLDQIDYFKDLPFYKLIWDRSRVENVRIERRVVKSINKELEGIISNYRSGNYPIKVLNGKTFESKELVIFVNSVKSICDIIKKNKLTPEETNIICAKTSNNISKLKKVKHTVGKAPLKGNPHKLITFCTRTTYLGSDFYSTSAYTIICSDCNVKTLTVDISLDLPQIVGRQRLKENVFRNEVLFLYKGLTKKDAILNLSSEEFEEYMENKEAETNRLLIGYSKMSEEEKLSWSKVAKDRKSLYQDDFLGVSNKTGKVVKNDLIKIANRRAYDVSRKEYQDMVTIKRGIESNIGYEVYDSKQLVSELDNRCKEFINKFESTGIFENRMELIYNNQDLLEIPLVQVVIPMNYQNYINMIGLTKIKALDFEEKTIKDYITSQKNLDSNRDGIISLFNEGEKYTKAEIKEMLKTFYQENNIESKPKASDIESYFEIKSCQITNKETGKRDHGFEILSKKGK